MTTALQQTRTKRLRILVLPSFRQSKVSVRGAAPAAGERGLTGTATMASQSVFESTQACDPSPLVRRIRDHDNEDCGCIALEASLFSSS